MKKNILTYCFLLPLCFLAALAVSAQQEKEVLRSLKEIIKSPPQTKLVHDYAGALSTLQELHLEDKLKRYDDSTANNLTVVLVTTLDGYSIEQGANELFRNWGIGQKGTDNGVLLLAAINDRKVRIEVGDGMERAVTDFISSQIIDNDIKPNFKQKYYYEGIDAATSNIIKAAEGQYKAPAGYEKKAKGTDGKFLGIMIMMFVVFFVLVAISRGGNNGGMMSRRGYSDWSGGGPIITNWGGGGSSSGGGSSGGGGFGGFGGGSSSGGGASGDW